jgi:hypothetical protein
MPTPISRNSTSSPAGPSGPTKTTGPDRTDYFGNTVIEYSTTSVCVEETPEQLDVLLNAMTVQEYEDEIVKSQEYMHSGLSGAQE